MDFRITEEQELMVQAIEEAMTKTTHIQRNGGKS